MGLDASIFASRIAYLQISGHPFCRFRTEWDDCDSSSRAPHKQSEHTCLAIGSLLQIPWMRSLLSRGIYFLLAGFVFVAGMSAAVYWVRYIKTVRGFWPVYVMIGFWLCSRYYLAVTSYVFGIYNYIPSNRGGRLPVTRAYLQIVPEESVFTQQRVIGNMKLYGPVYIIEDHQDS